VSGFYDEYIILFRDRSVREIKIRRIFVIRRIDQKSAGFFENLPDRNLPDKNPPDF